jgi:hypothetical protein
VIKDLLAMLAVKDLLEMLVHQVPRVQRARLERRVIPDNRVRSEQQAKQVFRDQLVQLAREAMTGQLVSPDLMVNRVPPALVVRVVLQDRSVLVVNLVNRAIQDSLVPQALVVARASRAQPAALATLASREQLVPLDSLELADQRVRLDRLEVLDCLDHKERQVLPGQPVVRVARDPLANREHEELLDRRDRRDLLDHLDLLEPQDSREHLVIQVHRELLEQSAQPVSLDPLETLDSQDLEARVEQLDSRVPLAILDTLARPDKPEALDCWEQQVPRVQPVHQDYLVEPVARVFLGQLDPRETLVTKDLRVCKVQRVQLGLVISVVMQDRRVQLDQLVTRDSLDRPDHEEVRGRQELVVQLAPRDQLDLLVSLEVLVVLEHLVHWDRRDLLVTLVRGVILALLAMLDSLDLLANWVSRELLDHAVTRVSPVSKVLLVQPVNLVRAVIRDWQGPLVHKELLGQPVAPEIKARQVLPEAVVHWVPMAVSVLLERLVRKVQLERRVVLDSRE